MGQHHHIYVIALVRRKDETTGQRRCIAAYHHQWCYGLTALLCLSRFLRLASQPDNALMIRREITRVQGRWGEMPVEAAAEGYVPCPFTAYLMQLSWNVNLNDVPVYVAGTTFSNNILDARMQTPQIGTLSTPTCRKRLALTVDLSCHVAGDGITVIDLTIKDMPSYCFNMIGGSPLTAQQYVRRYYRQRVDLASISDAQLLGNEYLREEVAIERGIASAISALEGVPLMSLDLLVEAWPQAYIRVREKLAAEGTYVQSTFIPPDESQRGTLPANALPSPPSPTTSSLVDITLHQAVLHAVNTGHIRPIQDAASQRDQREIILSALCEISPLPRAGVELLTSTIGRDQPADALDLSGFELSPSAVLGLVDAAGSALVKLDLTGNNRVNAHDLLNILSAAPHIRRLIIFDCSLVSDEDIYDILASSPQFLYGLEFIGHDAFFRRARDGKPACPYVPAFTCVVGARHRQPFVASLPYFAPNRLLRSIYTLLRPVAAAAAALAALDLPSGAGRTEPFRVGSLDPTLTAVAVSGFELFNSSAVLHAAFTTWYGETVSVTDAISATESQEPDPSGLKANTQRITMIPQASISWDGWLLLIEPGKRCAIARKRRNTPAAVLELEDDDDDEEWVSDEEEGVNDNESKVLDLEIFSVHEFIKALEEEGRPAPPIEDVEALADIIEAAFPDQGGNERFDSAEAVTFLAHIEMKFRFFSSM
ncbi:unnamed protein product [Peniophora sp. CBMAI 1063]|nr:unnamed protein product [Peniophora sp. CBMAI 1063]